MFSTVIFSSLSFILVGLSLSVSVVIFGVVCASISSGFGEITFLSYTAHYHKSSVSAWSAGTGRSHSHTTTDWEQEEKHSRQKISRIAQKQLSA